MYDELYTSYYINTFSYMTIIIKDSHRYISFMEFFKLIIIKCSTYIFIQVIGVNIIFMFTLF